MQQIVRRFFRFIGDFYGQLMEKIGLKAPGNGSASFWSYNFSICLCERPKPNISRISGFLRPVGALTHGCKYTKLLKTKSKTNRGTHFNQNCFGKVHFLEFVNKLKFGERWSIIVANFVGPNHVRDRFDKKEKRG